MSCYVMNPHSIKRLAELLTYCFSVPQNVTAIDIRWHIANAAKHTAGRTSSLSAAPYTLPVRWSDREPVTPAMMAARLYAINDAAYAYHYHGEALGYNVIESMFAGYDYEEFPKLTVDYLGRMLKTLQCYMYQCDVYDGQPQFLAILKAVEFTIMQHLCQECCQSYGHAKWGE